jgi:hypothetical protein
MLLPTLEKLQKNKDKCFKDARNFVRLFIALTTFLQIKNRTIASITTEAIPQFFKDFILSATNTLAHFTTNWISYVIHANKVATVIFAKLIQKNTYEQYVSAKNDDVFTVIKNNNEYLLFLIYVYKYLNEVDPPISLKNIKQFFNALNKVIINTVKHNLA